MSDNPTVNRYIKDKAMDHVDHALGRPLFPLQESYRNRFATNVGGQQAKEFDASPHWELFAIRGGMAFYGVTTPGREALAAHLAELPDRHLPFEVSFEGYSRIVPAHTRGSAKYNWYLEISDSWSELTFGEFCKRASVRKVAA
jgi:hypothetical protein